METPKHTPTPWEISTNEDSNETVIREPVQGRIIANLECDKFGLTDEEIKTNAEFIVRACNNRQSLLDAVKSALNYRLMTHHGDDELLKILTNAIQKAQQ